MSSARRAPVAAAVIALFHHRWALPLIAELHRSSGAKFVTLVRRLGIPRESLQRTLAALVEGGWVERNPGYGHPLRPEYVLSSTGSRRGASCGEVLTGLRRLGLGEFALRKWPIPVVLALADGQRRFSGLLAALPGITPRALAAALKDLRAAELVRRSVTDAYPPATFYRLTPAGRRLARLATRLTAG